MFPRREITRGTRSASPIWPEMSASWLNDVPVSQASNFKWPKRMLYEHSDCVSWRKNVWLAALFHMVIGLAGVLQRERLRLASISHERRTSKVVREDLVCHTSEPPVYMPELEPSRWYQLWYGYRNEVCFEHLFIIAIEKGRTRISFFETRRIPHSMTGAYWELPFFKTLSWAFVRTSVKWRKWSY